MLAALHHILLSDTIILLIFNEIILNNDDEPTEPTPDDLMKAGDLPGTPITEVDRMMFEVYGDKVHQNDGTHLDGGIPDDKVW